VPAAYPVNVHELTSSEGVVALLACVAAVAALVACLGLRRSLQRLRAEQLVILGDRREDLVGHAASLQRQFNALSDDVGDLVAKLHDRIDVTDKRLDQAVVHHGLVHFDAYGDMSGRRSTSLALLDARGSGIVLSSIHHRDQARLYAKQLHEGHSELELSPEEDEVVRLALARERQADPVD
jgi:ABC-type multidrug transport system fused ATPase/permease subunit